MGKDFTNKSRQALAQELGPGEEIVQSVLAEPEGSMLQQMSMGKMVGHAAWDGKKIRDARDPDTLASQVSRKRHVITRTNQRVLFHKASIAAKATTLSMEFPLDQIEMNGVRIKRKTYVLVKFPDDSALTFQCQHNQPVENMGQLIDLS